MKVATTSTLLRGLLPALLIICAASAHAQVRRLDCAPPRGVSRSDAVTALIKDAERDCGQGNEMLDQAKEWRDIAEDLRDEADRFRKEADRLRDDAGDLRGRVAEYREMIKELQEEADRIQVAREELDREISLRDQLAGAFRGSIDTTIAIPLPGADQWKDGEDRYARARIRYYEVRLNAIDDEIITFEGSMQVDEELSADKETAAVDMDQLALNNERAALEADASASIAEEAALLAERQAVMHNLQACTQFIALNLNDGDARRNVRRAVTYIEKHGLLLTGLDAEEADRVVNEARIRFDL